MMASSTTTPIATAKPPRVIVFSDTFQPVEDEHRREQRERNGDERDEGDPQIEQEKQQHDADERAADDQRILHVAERGFDEGRRPVQPRQRR